MGGDGDGDGKDDSLLQQTHAGQHTEHLVEPRPQVMRLDDGTARCV